MNDSVTLKPDDLAHVVRLAALTEDRSPEESRALAKIACRVDNALNKATFDNIEKRGHVYASRLLLEVGPQHATKADLQRWQRQIDRWYAGLEQDRRHRVVS